jgi:hypothetical protein
MHGRRSFTTLSVGVLTLGAGCTEFLGSGPAEFTAEPALVAEATASEQGYELSGTQETTVEQTLSVAGVEETVVVTNQLATYDKSIDLGPLGSQRLAVVGVVSSPAVEVAGQPLNPIADWDNARLVEELSSSYEQIQNVTPAGESTHTVLDTSATVSRFTGTTTVAGQQIDLVIHVTKVPHEGDYVAVVGVYPQQLSGEESAVFAMMGDVVHPAEQ